MLQTMAHAPLQAQNGVKPSSTLHYVLDATNTKHIRAMEDLSVYEMYGSDEN